MNNSKHDARHYDRQISAAVRCIADGGVIAYPTESCFGLGCDPSNDQAIERLLKIKQRSAAQGLILVAASKAQLRTYVDWDQLSTAQQIQIESSWPGPISWLIPARPDCSTLLTGRHTTLAVRVSSFQLVHDLCLSAKTALVSTSSNRHQQTALTTAAAVAAEMSEEIDYIVDLPIQGLAQPSQIIDAITQKILRP